MHSVKVRTWLHMLMVPLKRPRAKYFPSFVQLTVHGRELALILATAGFSGDQKPKSTEEQLTRTWVTGLKAMHWMGSLCLP